MVQWWVAMSVPNSFWWWKARVDLQEWCFSYSSNWGVPWLFGKLHLLVNEMEVFWICWHACSVSECPQLVFIVVQDNTANSSATELLIGSLQLWKCWVICVEQHQGLRYIAFVQMDWYNCSWLYACRIRWREKTCAISDSVCVQAFSKMVLTLFTLMAHSWTGIVLQRSTRPGKLSSKGTRGWLIFVWQISCVYLA